MPGEVFKLSTYLVSVMRGAVALLAPSLIANLLTEKPWRREYLCTCEPALGGHNGPTARIK
jgi:hypothetical protein